MTDTTEAFAVLSQIEKITSLSRAEAIEIMREAENGEDDIYSPCGNWRFINDAEIDEIQQEELKGDAYMLGCFNASFLSSILGVDQEAIEAIQQAEAYDGLGQMILSGGHLEDLQLEYAKADGYGHHFAHYDHNDHEMHVNGQMWHVFQVN